MELHPPTLDDVRAAQRRIAGTVLRTPLIPLGVDFPNAEIWLKLECLQPIGSFKLRGAGNALASADPDVLRAHGVYTASAGNMAQGVAWWARKLGVTCTVIVPDHAPAAKLDAIARLGGSVVKVPFVEWWQVLIDHGAAGMDGVFVHPVSDPLVIAGNGTIGLEVLDDLPDVDAVLVPFGGGGLSCGIAAAVKAVKPDTRMMACEVETAAPLAASLASGRAETVEYTPTFVDGIGGRSVLAEMWPLARDLLDGSFTVSVEDVARTVKTLVERNHVVAEGAGAASVAAAINAVDDGRLSGHVVCIVSGGNIDPLKVATILSGGVP